MVFIRSLIFKIAFPIWLFICCFLFCGYLIFKSHDKKVAFAGRFWSRGVIFLLKYICNITYEVRGAEHLPKTPFILACKHLSAWETIFFLSAYDNPVYVLKKELLKVPMFGRYLIAMKMISVDRSKGTSSIKKLQNEAKQRLDDGRNIVLFPEGTRQSVDAPTKCQSGVAFLYLDKNINYPIIPSALNSGYYWNKSFLKKSGKVIIEYMPAIENDLNRKDFMSKLESDIENSYQKLLSEANQEKTSV